MKLLLILCALQVNSIDFSPESLIKVTVDVLANYHSTCLYILHSAPKLDYSQKHTNVEFMKNLIKIKHLQIAVQSMKTLLVKNENVNCNEKLPFYIILTSEESVQLYLNLFSRRSIFTSGRWLMFLGKNVQLEYYFSGIDFPYDCEFIIVQNTSQNILTLTEVYRHEIEESLHKYVLAEWFNNNLKWTNLSLLRRRENLHGHQIRVSIFPEQEKYVKSNCNGFEKEEFCKAQYKIWRMIEREANAISVYISDVEETVDVGNKTWSGGIAQLILNKSEVAISPFGMTTERISVVNYISNAFPAKLTTYIRKESEGFSKWDHVIEPFSPSLWCTIFFSLIVFTILWSSTWYATVRMNISPESEEYTFENTWILVIGCFCQQGHETTPQAWSCRLIFITAYFTYLIIISAYSAIFISFLTVEHHEIPFTTFQELLETESYEFGTYGHELYVGMFEKATNPTLREVYERFLLHQVNLLPKESEDALRQVCERNEYAFAFVEDDVEGMEPMCEILALPRTTLAMYASFIIRKNSPYHRFFNHHMENIRRFGFLQKINTMKTQLEEVQDVEPQAGLEDVLVMFVILIFGLLISLLCLAVEKYNFKYENLP
ncbi:Ionotropic receptor 163 [Blattella germanica]|nr:Ionotropic receptor 163 [Blattella germanica]